MRAFKAHTGFELGLFLGHLSAIFPAEARSRYREQSEKSKNPPFAAGFCDGRYWARAAVRVSSLGQQG
jgi:hypothetical protein